MKIRNVLSLFDGISCGQLALHRVGIEYDTYYASEIEKQPIWITQYNFPNTIQLGDVEKWRDWDIEWDKIDLLIGGSPCTNLSIAGNREGLKGEESRLFYSYVDILNHIKKFNPNIKFLLENVESMSDENKGIINSYMGCKPVMINSALLSAQNRKRYYWVNWHLKKESLFGLPTCTIPQPEDKNIILQDVLESGYGVAVEERGTKLNYSQNKASCLMARDYKGFGNQQMTGVAEPMNNFVKKKYEEFANEKGYIPTQFNPYNKAEIIDKAPTQTCKAGSTTTSSSVLIFDKIQHPIHLSNYDLGNGQAQKVYSVRGKSVTLVANGGGQGGKTGLYKINLPDGDYIIRKLTPVECERLQTVPDGYTEYGFDGTNNIKISNSARYKALGNGWTVDVISHIFSFLV